MFNNIFPYTDFHELNLDWILAHFKEFIEAIASLEAWKTSHEAEYQQLKDLYDDIISGDFPQSMKDALERWVRINGVDIIGELVKMVFFGITMDGYFVAYIPDSWDEITFGTTGLDDFPAGVEYGHLTLSY